MDERFELAKRVPQYALKQITGGRLNRFTSISPMWRTLCLTTIYGLCGEGWKYEIVNIDKVENPNGEILVFMQVNLYVKGKDGTWSAPIPGYGGDYIIKKESGGLRSNDEAMKMVLTDALGDCAKQVGCGADIYLGLFDGSKYTRSSDEVFASAQPQTTQQQAQNDTLPAFDKVDGQIVINVNGRMYPLNRFNLEQLNRLQNDTRYSEIGNEIRNRMTELAG